MNLHLFSALFIQKQMASIAFGASAMIFLLVLMQGIIRASAEEFHSYCEFEHINEDSDCHFLHQKIPQNGKNMCLYNMINDFLSTGNLKMGSMALSLAEEYGSRINKSIKEESINDSTTYNSTEDLHWFLCLQKVLTDLLKLAKNQLELNAVETNWTHIHKAYEENLHHPAPAYALAKTAAQYSNVLNSDLVALRNFNSSYSVNGLLMYSWISNVLSSSEQKEQQLAAANMIKKEFSTFVKTVDVINTYVNPAVYGPIFILGVILNGTMIIICVRHKEIRTPPNIMLFNLAVADILNLTVNVPFAQLFKPTRFTLGKSICRLFLILRHMSISVSALSIVALSWQRYAAVKNAFKVTSDFTVFIQILVVWLIALGDGCLNSLILNDPCYTQIYVEENSKILDLNNFLLYCVFLPLAMVIISVLTALKLNNSAKTIPGAHTNRKAEIARYRSARIVACLAIVFLISNIPISLRFVLHTWFSISPSNPLHTVLIDSTFFFLLFSNSWFNPIALYIASKLFRGYFQRYLFCPFLTEKLTHRPSQTTKSVSDEMTVVQLNVKMNDSSFH